MTATTELINYDIHWNVTVQLPASMQVSAPKGLTPQGVVAYVKENCMADFDIDTDDFEYDGGFEEMKYGVMVTSDGFDCLI